MGVIRKKMKKKKMKKVKMMIMRTVLKNEN
jgi:hypothetical protein